MQLDEFRKEGHRLIDWLSDYYENIRSYSVKAKIKPGNIYNQLPLLAPEEGEEFGNIWKDFLEKIMPGITHWQHPHFHAYFPANTSYPSILAEIIVSGLAPQCMIWETSPAAAELEEKVLDWLKNALPLGADWHGVIQDTASTATLCALLSAREKSNAFQTNLTGLNHNLWRVYCSPEAHSSVDKAMRISGLGSHNLVKVPSDNRQSLDPVILQTLIESDLRQGLKPLAVVAAVGTTSTLAADNLARISKITSYFKLWLHVDAAYAGIGCLLPEYHHLLHGVQTADSIVINAHKWMFTNFDCSLYYVKDRETLIKTFTILPEYLKTATLGQVNDYRDWGIQLGRRFRALKLWFVVRSMGLDKINKIIRQQILWTNWLEQELRQSHDLDIVIPARMNVLCFRWKHPQGKATDEMLNTYNQERLNRLNSAGKLYLTHTKLNGLVTIRLVLGQTYLTAQDVREIPALLKASVS